MKEKETKKLYNSMTHVKEDYIEEAWKEKAKKKHSIWIKWGMVAACLFFCAIAVFEISNIFHSVPVNDDYIDVGIEEASLDGNPNDYGTGQMEQADGDMEIAAQKQETESLPEVSAYAYEGEACYISPNNGQCIYSIPLQRAMEEYGDAVLYKVVVDVFSDNNLFESNSEAVKEEIERLAGINYTVDLEHCDDGTMNHYYFVLCGTEDQLINFAGNDNYGYVLWLYDERAK